MGVPPLGAAMPKDPKKKWQKKGKCHLRINAPYLAILRGACDNTDTLVSPTFLHVKALLDTGAVVGNYCSLEVGEWVRQYHPVSWHPSESEEEIALATEGARTISLGSCNIDLILLKEDSHSKHTLVKIHTTVIDLAIDFVVGRPVIREEHLVHVFPHYFCSPTPPSALSQPLHASPVVRQIRDAKEKLLDDARQPSKPVGQRGRNTGDIMSCISELQHPQGAPQLGRVGAENTETLRASRSTQQSVTDDLTLC
jgi:hypothetical protein